MGTGGIHQLLSLGGAQPDRFLTKHVLARFHGLDRDRYMQVVGKRIVDSLDFRIGK